ncbi:MAG: bis(5'-nucleosyl)-tetraphosphatase (symmetrical) YqeK, partial [Dehalococcoidia bacterium]
RVKKGSQLLSLARDFGLSVTPLDERVPVLLHGPVGAEILRRDFQIRDEEVLEAVRCHTIGKAGMGAVARVLYLADKIEPSKDARYPFNSEVRELAGKDLDRAILKFIDCEVSALISRGELVHPSTIEARNHLLVELRRL